MSTPTTRQWLRTAVHRISTGSGRRATYLATWLVHRVRRTWQRTTRWLEEGTGLSWWLRLAMILGAAAIARKILTVLATGLYHRAATGGAPWLLWGTALWWGISAYRAGADDWKPKRPAIPAETSGSDDTEGGPAQASDESAVSPDPVGEKRSASERVISDVELIAAVRDVGTPHAQLVPLAGHLRVSTDAVRAAAARMGWTVKDVRQSGRSASAGLRWDEVPPPPPAEPLPGVVGAGQRADDDNDDTLGGGPREGVHVAHIDNGLRIYDLADYHRRRGTVGH